MFGHRPFTRDNIRLQLLHKALIEKNPDILDLASEVDNLSDEDIEKINDEWQEIEETFWKSNLNIF